MTGYNHNHNHNHDNNYHSHDSQEGLFHHHHGGSGDSIKTAFLLNLSFTIIEIIGGILTNSMAILSDALHDFGDSLSLAIAWYLEKLSKKKPDKKFSYGYGRFSLLGALITSAILIVGAVIIFINAIPRIIEPQGVYPQGMLGLSILGILINGAAFLRLRKSHTFNEKMAAWHVLEDVLGWLVVLLVSVVLIFKDWFILDPLLSVGITLYVLFNVARNLKKIFKVLLQGVPQNVSIENIEELLSSIEGVRKVYHTHLWSLEGSKNMLSTHLEVAMEISREDIIRIKKEALRRMKEENIYHLTLQIDFPAEELDKVCLLTE